MVNHGTPVKIMAKHDTWNGCQDHGICRGVQYFIRILSLLKSKLLYFQAGKNR